MKQDLQSSGTESPEISSHAHGQIFPKKGTKIIKK